MQEHWQEKPIDGADGEVQRALTSLSPAPSSIDRDRLLFTAGYRSAQQKLWMWRGMTGSLAAILLVSIFIRPQLPTNTPLVDSGSKNIAILATQQSSPADLPLQRVANRWLEAFWTTAGPSPEIVQPQNTLAVRQAVLERGMGALPVPDEDISQRPDLQRLLDLRLGEPADASIYKLMKRPGQSL
jgi:hypothetical protein